MKFLSPEVALYLYKSTIRPCMEYCCHVWAGAPSCYLELLDKLQKRICRTVGPSLAASLEPLAHRRNVASLRLLYRYYFGRCSCELAQLVPLLYSRGRATRYSDRLHDFSVTSPRFYKDVFSQQFISSYNYSLEFSAYTMLSFDLWYFNCRFSLVRFPVCFNLFMLLFLVTPCLAVAVQLCTEWIPIKKKSINDQKEQLLS